MPAREYATFGIRSRVRFAAAGTLAALFMAELNGNLLVAQSGGPTAVINASIAGVIQQAGHHECIEEIYGGLNGILGILRHLAD